MKRSPYIEWAKIQSVSEYNLATSGLKPYPLERLDFELAGVLADVPAGYGYAPLRDAIASKYNVSADCVVTAMGSSFANHLAMATVLNHGDEVLIEHPAYEPLLAVAQYLGANVKRFGRPAENGFKVDLQDLRRNVTSLTRLIVVTNLHNPTSALMEQAALREIQEIARDGGARILVDEVYLDLLKIAGREAPSAFDLGDEFIVTGSLTKVYGLGGLRCGWIISAAALASEMWRMSDIFYVNAAHSSERLSLIALNRLQGIGERAASLLSKNRELLDQFLNSRYDLETLRTEFGTVVFPRLMRGDVAVLCRLLREKYQTTVVPGSYFGMPDRFRIGIGGDTGLLAKGLERLGAALDDPPKAAMLQR